MRGLGLAWLRLAAGTVFIAHGLMRLQPSPDGGAAMEATLAALDFRMAAAVAMTLGGVEIAGGALLLVGAYTGWTSLSLLLTTMAVAWRLRPPLGLLLDWPLAPGVARDFELDLMLVGTLICLFVAGPGSVSFDRVRTRAAENEAAARARVHRR